MSLRNKTFHGILWVFSTNMTMKFLNLSISVILARLLKPSDFGLVALTLTIINVFDIIREFGIGQAIIQRKENTKDVIDSAFFIFPIISVFLYVIIYLISPLAATLFKEPELEKILRIAGLTLIIWSFGSLPQTLLVKDLKFKKLSISQIFPRIIYGIVTILMAFQGFGVWSLIWGTIIMQALSVITLWNTVNWRPSFRFDLKIAYELLSYGKHVILASLLTFFVSIADTSVIGYSLGSEKLGYYSIALTISGIFTTQISAILSQVLFPVYSKVQEEKDKLSWAYIKTLKGISMITFPAAFGIISISWNFIKIFYGEKWLPATVALQVLCIYGLNISILNVTQNLYLAVGKPQIMKKIYFIQLSLILILIYPLTNKYGIVGTSIVVTISSVISMFITINEAGKVINSTPQVLLYSMLPSLTSSIFMASFVFILQHFCNQFQPYLVLPLSIIFGASSYYLFIWIVYKKEIENFKILFKTLQFT